MIILNDLVNLKYILSKISLFAYAVCFGHGLGSMVFLIWKKGFFFALIFGIFFPITKLSLVLQFVSLRRLALFDITS